MILMWIIALIVYCPCKLSSMAIGLFNANVITIICPRFETQIPLKLKMQTQLLRNAVKIIGTKTDKNA